ncbi:MAG TPA: hypothetical protein VFY49_11700 [Myxococcota bacterium]|nr:hypothetical protein [Myxococcota bacterium]
MRRVLAALVAALGMATPAAAVELVGTWYVLVHYKDDNAGNPEAERWDDRVWVFEKQGTNLKWTEYPIAVFDDESGRFERRDSGQYARILGSWEPSEAQLADIRDGLQVNSRGSKTKTLRGADAKGWTSGRRGGGSASASVISYEEVWAIEGLPARPVFTRSDFMGGGRTDTLEGSIEYATTESSADALSGTYERDGTRHGTFRMLRSGAVGELKGAGSQEELQKKVVQREVDRAIARGEDVPGEWVAPGANPVAPALPRDGMKLDEVVAAVRTPPSGANQRSALTRKVEVLRLRPDGYDLVADADIASLRAAPGESYGVIALQYCGGPDSKGEHTSWYLVTGEGLVAWDHYDFVDQCVYTNRFQPATGEHVAQERLITERKAKAFPPSLEADAFYYAKGIRYAKAGRIDDAKKMLAAGDANLTAGVDGSKTAIAQNRTSLVSRSTDTAMRQQLVDAIATAEKSGGAAPKKP